MAVKVAHADTYLAKGEIEHDFLVRSCGVAAEKVVLGGQGLASAPEMAKAAARSAEPWLVFFTEPFQAVGWRTDEVYRDLLPKLWSLAQSCGLKLVFKLHPFESVRGHRRILRKYLPQQEAGNRCDCRTTVAATLEEHPLRACRAIHGGVAVCVFRNSSVLVFVAARFQFGIRSSSSPNLALAHPGIRRTSCAKFLVCSSRMRGPFKCGPPCGKPWTPRDCGIFSCGPVHFQKR